MWPFPTAPDDEDPEGPNLWEFRPARIATLTGAPLPECTAETGTGHGMRLVRDIYRAEGSDEQSVPVLYDKRTGRIVNNESADILRMLNRHAGALGQRSPVAPGVDLYPRRPGSAGRG